MKRTCLVTVLFSVFLACAVACGVELAKETDSVLASVNGEPVSLSDVLYETPCEFA